MEWLIRQLGIFLTEDLSLRECLCTLRKIFGEDLGQSIIKEFGDKLGEAIRVGRHSFGVLGSVIMTRTAAKSKPAMKPTTHDHNQIKQMVGRIHPECQAQVVSWNVIRVMVLNFLPSDLQIYCRFVFSSAWWVWEHSNGDTQGRLTTEPSLDRGRSFLKLRTV